MGIWNLHFHITLIINCEAAGLRNTESEKQHIPGAMTKMLIYKYLIHHLQICVSKNVETLFFVVVTCLFISWENTSTALREQVRTSYIAPRVPFTLSLQSTGLQTTL